MHSTSDITVRPGGQDPLAELALALVGDADCPSLTRDFCQRLLAHSGFAVVALLRRAAPGQLEDALTAVLVQAVGAVELQRLIGQAVDWPASVVAGPSGALPVRPCDVLDVAGLDTFESGARLVASGGFVFLLFGGSGATLLPELVSRVEPALAKFGRAYKLARARDEQARQARLDADDRRRLEEQLRSAMAAADQASALRHEFTVGMGRALRASLSEILGRARVLNADAVHPRDLREDARVILAAGQRLQRLVNDVLDLSDIDSGRLQLHIDKTPVGAILAECGHLVEREAHMREVVVETGEGLSLAVLADPTRFRQILLVLLMNAVRHSPAGGTVTAWATHDESGHCRIHVRDSGAGVPAERLSSLFEPFRDPGAVRGVGSGTGIGLVVARRLARLMNGDVGVSSRLDEGSTFWLDLPSFSPPPAPAPTAANWNRHDAHVLLAEDHPMNQKLIGLQLSRLGYTRVTIVANGRDALDAWAGGGVDVLLTDCHMPELDGFGLATAIRARETPGERRLPIIAITAGGSRVDSARCEASGIDACLFKPLTIGALRGALERWIVAPPTEVAEEPASSASSDDVRSPPVSAAQPYLDAVSGRLGGATFEEARGLLLTFLESGRRCLDEGAEARRAQDSEPFIRAMHKLKSSAGFVGAVDLATTAAALEAAGTSSAWEQIEPLFVRAELAFMTVEVDLVELLPEPGTLPVERASARATPEIRGLRLLVLDDDVFIRQYLAEMLRSYGAASVHVAEDGRRGLAEVISHAHEIDVVLCDLNMPGMDGVEFLRHLAQTDFDGSLVLISGEGDRMLSTVFELARQHGFQVLGTLRKPFDPDRLLEQLRRHRRAPQEVKRERGQIVVTPEEVRHALQAGEFTIHIQPKVSAVEGAVVGGEVLARWFRPGAGFVPPGVFVPIAEANGLVDALFLSVFDQTLALMKRMGERGRLIKLAVNVSATTLIRLDLAELVFNQSRKYGVDPENLTLEITESGIVTDMRVALDALSRLRLRRVGLSIDDFGTGYSSMDQLRRIPFTELKLDRSFVSTASRDAAARHILVSSIELANGLGIETVAEGVETEAELALMRELGCDVIQGYFIARPMDADAFIAWVEARSR